MPKPPRALLATGTLAAALAATAAAAGPGGARQGDEPQEHRAKVRMNGLASFDKPLFVAAPEGAGELAFVVERKGKIRLLEGERKRGTFLDMRRWVGCCHVETGLFSVAFAPDYERTRRFYVYFTNKRDNIEIDEFKASRGHPRKADRGSRRKLLEIKQTGEVNHNGGTVAFGPDGYLYAATGDGGRFDNPSANAQKKGSLLGKLIRIDPRRGKHRPYRIPPSNPYAGKAGQNEIYARGLRNPFRFTFDGSRIVIADVGQSRREEVDIESARKARGANFGWNVYEGSLRFRPGSIGKHTKPAHQYSHSGSNCSITGGVVIRDERLPRSVRGRYVYADYCSGFVRSFIPKLGGSRRDSSLGVGNHGQIVGFGEDARERVYVVQLSGQVSRLDPR
ncbi:MAG TPA: PQQ-dependent sugar dehydrogenase [Solirubrobacterales bacterium]